MPTKFPSAAKRRSDTTLPSPQRLGEPAALNAPVVDWARWMERVRYCSETSRPLTLEVCDDRQTRVPQESNLKPAREAFIGKIYILGNRRKND